MLRRKHQRIHTNLPAVFFSGNVLFRGIINNCSEKGMYLKTSVSFPIDLMFELHISMKEETVTIHVKIIRFEKSKGFYTAIGIELLDPPLPYLTFLKSPSQIYNDQKIMSLSSGV